jgi:hypothetical protein
VKISKYFQTFLPTFSQVRHVLATRTPQPSSFFTFFITMTKSTKPLRRTNKVSTKPAAKATSVASPARSGKKMIQKVLKTGSKIPKTNSNVIELKHTHAINVKGDSKLDSNTCRFGTTLNKTNEEVLLAPLTVDLTRLFFSIDCSYKEEIQGYEFQVPNFSVGSLRQCRLCRLSTFSWA